MCCFSRPVDRVANTNIFARSGKEGRQFLVYSMILSAKEDLAMILPIPVPKESKDDAVRFINLEKYPEFFQDMNKGFPPPASLPLRWSRPPTLARCTGPRIPPGVRSGTNSPPAGGIGRAPGAPP